MTSSHPDTSNIIEQQLRIEKAGKLHWFHWLIIGASLLLTLSAWYFTYSQVQQKNEALFNRQAEQIVELISERMQRYEDALRGGVATIYSQSNGIDNNEWRRYAEALKLEDRYPGINGIGVIFEVKPEQLDAFLASQRQIRPDFFIHPAHEEQEYLPITFIEPVSSNTKAVGLDMAHETNRYTAAKKARDSGQSQITAPIVLVQDAEKTPGFLLFSPFYNTGFNHKTTDINLRRANFLGLVYAPFIMKKLMQGTLDENKRYVGLQIRDGDNILYDEHALQTADFNPDTALTRSFNIEIYGRPWTFDIWSTLSFRQQTQNHQPALILIGGIIIDILLLTFFTLLARSNRMAINFAKLTTGQYQKKAEELAEANTELEEFTYRTSHDLRSPLTSSVGLLGIAKASIEKNDTSKALQCVQHAEKSLETLKHLVEDIMHLAKTKLSDEADERIDIKTALEESLEKLCEMEGYINISIQQRINFNGTLIAKKARLLAIIENLLSNAIKYHDKNKQDPYIIISAYQKEAQFFLEIEDNGLGIPAERRDKLFTMFKRFHPQTAYGSGLGLYMIKKGAQLLGGDILYRPAENGSIFTLHIPIDSSKKKAA